LVACGNIGKKWVLEVLEAYVKEKALGHGHQGKAADILKNCGIQSGFKNHQLSL
jgi:hypothetical protein